jgi:hypothetical protein
VLRGRTCKEVSRFNSNLQLEIDAIEDRLPEGTWVNGLRYDNSTDAVQLTSGKNPLELREVRFLQLAGKRWGQKMVDAFGFPFRTDTDAARGIIESLRELAKKRIKQSHEKSKSNQPLGEYESENLTHEYIICLGEDIEKRHGTAEVWQGAPSDSEAAVQNT